MSINQNIVEIRNYLCIMLQINTQEIDIYLQVAHEDSPEVGKYQKRTVHRDMESQAHQ